MAKNAIKKDDGARLKQERQSASATLTALVGADVNKMTDKELRQFMGAMGQLAGLLDEKNKVKPLV